MTRYGWEIIVPARGQGYFGCAVPPSESVKATIEALRADDPAWYPKPRLRPLREPAEGYDKDARPGGLRIRYYVNERLYY